MWGMIFTKRRMTTITGEGMYTICESTRDGVYEDSAYANIQDALDMLYMIRLGMEFDGSSTFSIA